MSEIFNPEDVKNEFIQNTIQEYLRVYGKQQVDLAVYFLNDFINNLVANDLVLLRLEPEPAPQQRQPVYQQPQPPRQQQYQQPIPQQQMRVQQPQNIYQQNPFEEEDIRTQVAEYIDPRTQRMRVEDFGVQREVAELNAQLQTPNPPRQMNTRGFPQQPQRQPIQQQQQDINLESEKSKTFVDKIKDMRTPRKKEGINPEE